MLVVWYVVVADFIAIEIRGINIMLNKPSIQSGSQSDYYSHYANDGSRTSPPTMTSHVRDPYWQGDLQGFYTVTSVSVTNADISYWFGFENDAFIGVSFIDVRCSKKNVTICGQWPGYSSRGTTKVFQCSHTGPVRYVRIWREGDESLSLGEVEVEGTPSTFTESERRSCGKVMVYDKVMAQKVITPTASLTVGSKIICAEICSQTKSCFAISYRSSEQPNCLLATDITMTSAFMWNSYTVNPCF